MQAHDQPLAASFVNWVGRTVIQIKQESALQRALSSRVKRGSLATAAAARQQRLELVDFVVAEIRAGRLALSPPPPTPLGWRIAQIVDAVIVPVVGLIALPFLICALAAAHFSVARA